jgi:hypothetical protein
LTDNVLRDSWELNNRRATIPADLALLRQRAHTLFLLAHDELRRASCSSSLASKTN